MKAESNQNPKKVKLNIPTRLQWQNAHGFCGQASIQTISLYYGSYISQQLVRQIAGGEVIVGQNAQKTIKRLGYQIEVWNNEQPKPQYKAYLQWVKKQLRSGNPVIIVGYDREGGSDQYDHIYVAVGYNSQNPDVYSDQDQLIYIDLFDEDYTVTKFGKIYGVKGMKNNDEDLLFAIPRNINYGIAILGIQDPEEQFLPIMIKLSEKSEPNVSMGYDSKVFKYTVIIQELEKGKRYAVLRYDSFKALPKKSIVANQACQVKIFEAKCSTYSFEDKVQSSRSVFYRCVEQQDLE